MSALDFDRDQFHNALQDCRQPPKAAMSLPPAAYAAAEVLTMENSQIFGQGWIALGRADQLPQPGDYRCLDFAGQALIIIRGKDKALHVHANTCRHRGARLLNGEGNTSGIRCPFHSWAYKLSGELAGAPQMEDADGFCKEDFGLISFPVQERLGFVFTCLGGDAPDLDDQLGNFSALHRPWPLEGLVTTRVREFTAACNWKAFIEVFNEYYHLPFVHPDSIDDVYNLPEPALAATGAFTAQFGSTEGTGGLLQDSQDTPLPLMPGLTGGHAAGVQYSWVFPNMTFAAGVDAMWVYEAYPLEAGQCLVRQLACFPPETVANARFEEAAQGYYHRLDAALAEDLPALENQHKGLANRHATPGRFQPLLEPNVAHFAAWYAGRMAGPMQGEGRADAR